MAEITYLFVLAIVFVAFNEVIKNIKKYPPCTAIQSDFEIINPNCETAKAVSLLIY